MNERKEVVDILQQLAAGGKDLLEPVPGRRLLLHVDVGGGSREGGLASGYRVASGIPIIEFNAQQLSQTMADSCRAM